MNILEFISEILPEFSYNVYFNEIPEGKAGLVISESSLSSSITSFAGWTGVVNSRIQLYLRAEKKEGFTTLDSLMRRLYKEIKASEGIEKGGIKLLYIDEFSYIPNVRDEKGNYIFSMYFPVIYKENI